MTEMVGTAAARAQTALLLYAGTAFLVGALYVLVWQTPVHQALETLPNLLPQVAEGVQGAIAPLLGRPPVAAPEPITTSLPVTLDLTPLTGESPQGTAPAPGALPPLPGAPAANAEPAH